MSDIGALAYMDGYSKAKDLYTLKNKVLKQRIAELEATIATLNKALAMTSAGNKKLEAALDVALEAMGLVGADLVCEASHHKKHDRHEIGQPCPLEKRWHQAFAKLKEVRK